MHRSIATLAVGWATLALNFAALAQPTHIRGIIQAVGDRTLTVVTREGPTITVALQKPLTVSALKPLDFSAIRSGSFIGTAARPGPDGKLVAQEVMVFPESARGTGEGYRGWDLTSDSTMTNATITALVDGTAGHEMILTYKGGSKTVVVPANAPIVGPAPAEPADLKPGTPVFFTPIRAPDGSLSVARIVVGKEGVPPPL